MNKSFVGRALVHDLINGSMDYSLVQYRLHAWHMYMRSSARRAYMYTYVRCMTCLINRPDMHDAAHRYVIVILCAHACYGIIFTPLAGQGALSDLDHGTSKEKRKNKIMTFDRYYQAPCLATSALALAVEEGARS